MANPVIDPFQVKYFPEMLVEVLNEPSITTGGQSIASYVMEDRRCVVENPVVFTQTANLDLVVSADSSERARIRSNAHTLNDINRRVKISAKQTLEFMGIMASGGPTANVRSSWFMTFRRPLPVDKLREDAQLDTSEESIADELHLMDNLGLGTIPYYESLLHADHSKKFDEIIVVERSLTAMAASSESTIGGASIPANDGLIVLLGVMVDTGAFAATPSDSFIQVDRDVNTDYMRIDITGISDQLYVPCYVPAIKKLEVKIETATGTGVNTVLCGFIYGRRKLNVGDHLRWNLPYGNNMVARGAAQKLINDYPKTAKSIQAGVY